MAAAHISIHALLAESDYTLDNARASSVKFLSTLSLRRATGVWRDMDLEIKISIHALLAESDLTIYGFPQATHISIHALLAESDPVPAPPGAACRYFYPRSPCGERHSKNPTTNIAGVFLSTLSLRRATINTNTINSGQAYFYPRSPCGERLFRDGKEVLL